MFRYKNNNIVNEKGKVMDVVGGYDGQHRNIQVFQKNNGLGQQFELVYVDEMPAVPKKGELNKSWGLYVERPFHIVSSLDSEKYIDLIGNNAVIKTPNGRTSQSWWFDQKTRTIKSWRTRSYTL
jgi:hypothetical protein